MRNTQIFGAILCFAMTPSLASAQSTESWPKSWVPAPAAVGIVTTAEDLLTMLSPAHGATYPTGTPVATSFVVVCDGRHEVRWKVKNMASGSEPIELGRVKFQGVASFTGTLAPSDGDYEFLVSSDCAGSKKVKFTVKP